MHKFSDDSKKAATGFKGGSYESRTICDGI